MIPLLQTKTADTAHTGIFASNTRPLSRFLGGAWGRGYSTTGSLASPTHMGGDQCQNRGCDLEGVVSRIGGITQVRRIYI